MKRLTLLVIALAAALNLGCTVSEYLIITHDDFYASVLPLKADKEADGFVVKLVKTSQIGTSPTAAQIAAYIRNEYKATTATKDSGVSLRYVLLVGDVDYLPTHYRSYPGLSDGNDHIATDLYYATMSTTSYLPHIGVGRLPVNTAAEATAVVNKIVSYVPWNKKAMLFGGSPEINYGTTHSSILTTAGFTVDITKDTVASTETIKRLNDGRALAAYYGHGYYQSMTSGQLSATNVNQLTNTQLPVIASGGCYNAWFDHTSLKSLGELLLLKPSGGAIAFVGSTRTGGYGYGYEFMKGFLDEYVRTGTLGDMLDSGRFSAYYAALANGEDVSAGSWTNRFVEKITLLGDPALDVKNEQPLMVAVLPDQWNIYDSIRNLEELQPIEELDPRVTEGFEPVPSPDSWSEPIDPTLLDEIVW